LEGTNDLATDLVVGCAAATLTSGTVVVQLTGTVTSQPIPKSTTSEATLNIFTASPTVPVTSIQGTISGSQVSFGSVTFPAVAYTIKIQNVRINSSLLTVGQYVTETLNVYNDGVVSFSSSTNIAASPGATPVGYVQQGFSVPNVLGNLGAGPLSDLAAPYPICQGNANTSFTIQLGEKFGGAFKTKVPTLNTVTGAAQLCNEGACSTTNGEQGTYQGAAPIGTATSGTRFLLSFAGIPSGVTVYLPVTVTGNSNPGATDGLILSLTSSSTAAFSAVSPIGTNFLGVPATDAAITATNGTATAVYEVTQTDNTIPAETASISGVLYFVGNFASVAPASPTVTVTPAPTGQTTAPNFATSSNPAITLNSFTACTTNLLFPFVTNQLGFDTGIVLANTSTDPFGVPGPPTFTGTGAAPAPGSCALNFYGAGAPTPNTGVAAPGGSQASGTTNAFQLSSVAPGFQGYVIAVCNYQYGHGYAFIEYDLTQGNGVAEGYLALVVPTTRSTEGLPESLNN
jgi:hypothetical protein